MDYQQGIRCSIINCHYYGQGNVCNAKIIMVTSDNMSNQLNDGTDAPQADQITQTPVGGCTETCCKTFVEKNSYKQNLDGVMKK